jgi:hypothetical protein
VEKNLLPLLGIELRPSSPYPAAIPTELSQLLEDDDDEDDDDDDDDDTALNNSYFLSGPSSTQKFLSSHK